MPQLLLGFLYPQGIPWAGAAGAKVPGCPGVSPGSLVPSPQPLTVKGRELSTG